MADELMRAIIFCTTPKKDLAHYSFIFKKPEILGTDIKNMVCTRLGMMLHLDIQNIKEVTKMSKFQKDLGGTAVCMKRLAIATKWCVRLK